MFTGKKTAGTADPLSVDLRKRVVDGLGNEMSRRSRRGRSQRALVRRGSKGRGAVSVGVSNAIRWSSQDERSGDIAPKLMTEIADRRRSKPRPIKSSSLLSAMRFGVDTD
jgi:hypothetical protein